MLDASVLEGNIETAVARSGDRRRRLGMSDIEVLAVEVNTFAPSAAPTATPTAPASCACKIFWTSGVALRCTKATLPVSSSAFIGFVEASFGRA